MPVSIIIRDVPDVREELVARAARSGRSLQEYLKRELTDLARKPDFDAVMTRILLRKATTGTTLSTESILSHRDADHR